MKIHDHDATMTDRDVADYLRVSIDTLRHWRMRGFGPRWAKLGSGPTARVRYLRSDVVAWVEQHRVVADQPMPRATARRRGRR
jgi:hypothetical protein